MACSFSSSFPQPPEEIYARYAKHHTSKEGLKSEKFGSKKLICDSFLLPDVKGDQWFMGQNLSPQGGMSSAERAK